jgi:hypothetical protein
MSDVRCPMSDVRLDRAWSELLRPILSHLCRMYEKKELTGKTEEEAGKSGKSRCFFSRLCIAFPSVSK